MIRAVFHKARGRYTGAAVSGHACYDDAGRDIVCAAVTSAVQLTCNGVTEVLKCGADVEATADTVRITLPPKADDSASRFIEALHVHLDILAHDYADFIEVSVHKNG